MCHILLVDDESAITDNLAPFLERTGFRVSVATNGESALQKIRETLPDIVVMDVMMPKMNGRQALRTLRKANNWLPVILLTQIGEATERVMALDEGADDYLNKPFDAQELVARVRAVLRRARKDQPPLSSAWVLSCHQLVFDRQSRRVTFNGSELTLTPKALVLLEYLMTHPDEMVTRERLLDIVWGWAYPVGARAIDSRIVELRRALKDDPANPTYIETVPGQGYRFSKDVQAGG